MKQQKQIKRKKGREKIITFLNKDKGKGHEEEDIIGKKVQLCGGIKMTKRKKQI